MDAINFDNHFRDLFENTHDLIYFLKIDGEIQLVNQAWLNTLKYELQDVAGKNIYQFIHPDYKEKYRKNRDDVIKNNKIKSIEVAYVTRENELVIGEGQVGCSYIN
jgi:PAS domain S-box-containing protein